MTQREIQIQRLEDEMDRCRGRMRFHEVGSDEYRLAMMQFNNASYMLQDYNHSPAASIISPHIEDAREIFSD